MLPKERIKSLLKKYNISPNKLLGQNFLIDRSALKKIIAAANLSKNDAVLEVGPGLGVLTIELAKYAGRVVAVEKDKELAAALGKILAEQNIKNVEIIEGDILKFPISNFQFPKNYKLVANIPYYLTSRLIRQFLESANPPKEIILMIQKEVAQRICAAPPRMSLLAAATQFYAQAKIVANVSKKSFWPAPKVDSAILRLEPLKSDFKCPRSLTSIEISKFFAVLHAGFSQPRKQLAGNLSKKMNISREKIIATLSATGIKPEQRAESLSVEKWIELSQKMQNGKIKR